MREIRRRLGSRGRSVGWPRSWEEPPGEWDVGCGELKLDFVEQLCVDRKMRAHFQFGEVAFQLADAGYGGAIHLWIVGDDRSRLVRGSRSQVKTRREF